MRYDFSGNNIRIIEVTCRVDKYKECRAFSDALEALAWSFNCMRKYPRKKAILKDNTYWMPLVEWKRIIKNLKKEDKIGILVYSTEEEIG
jgi:hypothetical protein